jgi:hypothetical protein
MMMINLVFMISTIDILSFYEYKNINIKITNF